MTLGMSLARAIETGDVTVLPGRRDEDWRWTDLRGLVREIPTPAKRQPISGGGQFGGSNPIVLAGGGFDGVIADRSCGGESFVRFVALEGSQHATLGVDIQEGAQCVLLESHEALADGYLSAVDLDINIGRGASLTRIVLADDAESGVNVVTATVTLAAGASFAQTILTTGAKRQRFETRVTHPGQDAKVRLDGAYLIGDRRHADFTTVVTHAGPGGATTQLSKGAVGGQGRAVFQGRIVVEKGADQTDARMGHHALILSDRGEVDAKPELLIHADDVSCAHGNTVGNLNQDALFYARQRGIPEAQAKAMLTEAFVGEVVDRIEHEGAREICRAWVAEKLRGLA